MRLDIPFVANPDEFSCAQAAMQGVLPSFGAREVPDLQQLHEASGATPGVWTSTAGMAVGLHQSGLWVEYCYNPGAEDAEAIAGTSRLSEDDCVAMSRRAARLGLERVVTLTTDDMRHLIDDGKSPVVLVDYMKLRGRGRALSVPYFIGHFLTVVGYEDDSFLVHNSGKNEKAEALPVNTSLFMEAFHAPGTFRDAAVVHGLR